MMRTTNQIYRFKTNRQLLKLVFGALLLVLVGYNVSGETRPFWTQIIYLIVGVFYFAEALWNLNKHYLTVTPHYIIENALFGTKINIQNITEIKKFTDEYTIYTSHKKLRVKGRYMTPESLNNFKAFITTLQAQLANKNTL
ncbi:hypothetical protein ACFSQP_07405 [Bizionia sediminis]|uniref:PH domain-containing protein n=1 Tax=Bizionia sediminis TaxID=1737064 RepID=A0ABW5KVN0_9FLAO